MSEYQYVGFLAVDRPLMDDELAFARKQSTRAEITRRSFHNEYHFGDFHGNVEELLRRGYDVHLHYANFGVRTVAFRLPCGLPWSRKEWSRYLGFEGVSWKKDRQGAGGVLLISPYIEAGEFEELLDPERYLDDMVRVRQLVLDGDLRALYALWLCIARSDSSEAADIVEPPTPGGLADSAEDLGPLLDFFGVDRWLLAAAAEGAPAAPEALGNNAKMVADWVETLDAAKAKQLLQRMLGEETALVKTELLASIRQASVAPVWPAASIGRTTHKLSERAGRLRAEETARVQKQREAAARRTEARRRRERHDRMQQMAKTPQKWLREATMLVDQKGTANYEQAAEILADLGKAVGGDEGLDMVRQHAAQLVKRRPTLSRLKASLGKRGLLD